MHLVKYHMPNCAPCLELERNLNSLDLGSITLECLDVFEQDRLTIQNLRVKGAPTMILYTDATKQVEIKRFTGSLSRNNLAIWLGLEEPN